MASKDEEELHRLSAELRFYEQTVEAMQSRINMVNAVITDLTYAGMTLETLEKEKENSELLVPIGGNSYIKTKLQDPDKLIMGIGAGVSVEKTLSESKEIVKKRQEELDKTRMSLQQQFVQVVDTIKSHREKIESLVAKMREGTASKDV